MSDHLNLGPVAYDNSELMSLLPKLHKAAKAHRDSVDKDILASVACDLHRDATFSAYAGLIDGLRGYLELVLEFQKAVKVTREEVESAQATERLLRDALGGVGNN
jgi:hypothetical protein